MKKRINAAEVRVVVEVDGNPVGFLNLDMERLWPLINHNLKETPSAEWIDSHRFDTMMRAVVTQNLSNRLQSHLYSALGNEIVKTELDIEGFTLRAEAAAQAFGNTRKEIEELAAKSGSTTAKFYEFFWKYMTEERDAVEPKKAWKKAAKA
ncbi:MAG TPA: hypothetical protein VFE29_09195 [Terriglobia bacterium]|nr:hypothetical protein [Terriglobia bacterium]